MSNSVALLHYQESLQQFWNRSSSFGIALQWQYLLQVHSVELVFCFHGNTKRIQLQLWQCFIFFHFSETGATMAHAWLRYRLVYSFILIMHSLVPHQSLHCDSSNSIISIHSHRCIRSNRCNPTGSGGTSMGIVSLIAHYNAIKLLKSL